MYLRKIFFCQEWGFFEHKYDQIKELQNGKDIACVPCHNKISSRYYYCNHSSIRRNILILKNLEFLSRQVLAHCSDLQQGPTKGGFLLFKFPNLSYRNTER